MSNNNEHLCLAIKARNCEKVEQLLKEGADPLARIDFDEFFTPWNWLYSCDSYSITSILLKKCPQAVNYKMPELCDETLLFGAILTENKVKIRLLVEKGADINIINENGYTPLYYTIGQSKEVRDLTPLLLDLGANIIIGSKKFKGFKGKELDDFYDYLEKFLEELHELGDMDELKKQTDRLLKLHNDYKISPKLLEKVNEIRDYYGFELEDSSRKAEVELA